MASRSRAPSPVHELVPDDPSLRELREAAARCRGCDLWRDAAQALLGSKFRVSQQRGEWVSSPLAPLVTATVHPSSILRAPDDEARKQAYKGLVADLVRIPEALEGAAGA